MAEFFGYTLPLYFDDGNGAQLVGQVRDIDGPGMSLDTVDVGSRDAGQRTKRIAGLTAGGSLTFDLVYDPDLATQTPLTSVLLAGTEGTFYLVIDALMETGWFGVGIVESFKLKTALEGYMGADLSISVARAVNTLNYLTNQSTDYMVDHAGNYWIV